MRRQFIRYIRQYGIVVVLLTAAAPSFCQSGNVVQASVGHLFQYYTNADHISNQPVLSNDIWVAELRNLPDATGASVFSPRIEVTTSQNFIQFAPTNPVVTPLGSGLTRYVWDFPGLEVKQPFILPLVGRSSLAPVNVQPRISFSRSVTPEILTQPVTTQTVTLNLKLEEPLPPEITNIAIGTGVPLFVFGGFTLVQAQIVSYSSVSGWNAFSDGASVGWHASASALSVGTTYTFVAMMQSTKSPLLLGSPLFKPFVLTNYTRTVGEPPVTGASATVTAPDNSIAAVFSVSAPVQWSRISTVPRYDFTLNPVVSQVTAPPPPFRVIVPATIRIQPETINLRERGVLTAFVQLEAPYQVDDIDISTVRCQGAPVESANRSNNALILKFSVEQLQGVAPGAVALSVTGLLRDGSLFKGSDTVRLIP